MANEVKFSIKSKFFIAIFFVAFLCVSFPLGYSQYLLKENLKKESVDLAQERLELARRIFRKAEGASFSSRAREVSYLVGQEVGFVSADGDVVCSTSWFDPKWNFMSREEIRTAKIDGTGFHFSHNPEYARSTLYSAIRIDTNKNITEGYILTKTVLTGFDLKLAGIWKVLFWVLPVIGLTCYLVSRFVTRQLSSSVESMVRTAEAVGQGNYKRRIRTLPDKEFLPLANAINWMAEKIGNHVGTITSQKNKLQAVLNGMWDGVMVMDSNCRIQSVNRALVEIIPGIDDCIGRSPLEVLPSPDLQDGCDSVLAIEGPDALGVQIALSTGRVYDVNIVRSPHTTEPGQGPGAIVVFHDISEIKRLETVRKDFVANVSHELRTPLTSIKGYAETLLFDPPPPASVQKTFLGTIEKNANHMCKIVDDLLNLSRLEGAKGRSGGEQCFKYVDPAVSLAQAWQSCSGLAEKRHVDLVQSIVPGEYSVEGDADQLMQVFRNLLENAIKYGPENKPVVVEHHVEGNELRFTVTDKGPGIPAVDQPRIFERFYSVEKFRRNEFGSTGLGLAICRHIVLNHSGEISVQSPPHGKSEGTAFVFTLPLSCA